MTKTTVLLTGAGGAALPALIDGLRAKQYRVVAVDADPNAIGLYIADAGYRVPFANDAQYLSIMRRICQAESIAALVPLVDEELLPVAQLATELGIALLGPLPSFTALCLDKFALMRRLADVGLPVPQTSLLREGIADFTFPLILKPRTGRGSRGIKIVKARDEYDAYLASAGPDSETTIVQTFVDGPEYTVSVVVWRDGNVKAVVPKEVVDKRGITRIAVTRENAAIDKLCREIQGRLRADGPFNVQLRLDPTDGTPLTFEINPRFSTTVTLTQAAGVDELGALLDLATGRDVGAHSWQWREGVTLLRRTLDSFVDEQSYRDRRHDIGKLS